MKQSGTSRRKFTKEFKQEALRLLSDERYTAPEVAEKLGVGVGLLYRWRRQQEESGADAFSGQRQAHGAGTEGLGARAGEPRAEGGAGLSKKNGFVFREGKVTRYSVIRAHEKQHRVRMMCRALNVSESAYRWWKRRPESLWERNRRELGGVLKKLFSEKRETYGSPRMRAELARSGRQHSKNYVAKVMRNEGLRVRLRGRFRVTTNSNHSLPIFPNLVQRNFSVLAPNAVWVSDVTYVGTAEGWLYLCTVTDLYSRKIVGWSMSERLSSEFVLSALKMATTQRRPGFGLIVHSDRGVQYASRKYRRFLSGHGFRGSMSRRGDCWDNAAAESLFATLKTELVNRSTYQTRAAARTEIFEYIEGFYNRERLHSTLGYCTPVEFEKRAA